MAKFMVLCMEMSPSLSAYTDGHRDLRQARVFPVYIGKIVLFSLFATGNYC